MNIIKIKLIKSKQRKVKKNRFIERKNKTLENYLTRHQLVLGKSPMPLF